MKPVDGHRNTVAWENILKDVPVQLKAHFTGFEKDRVHFANFEKCRTLQPLKNSLLQIAINQY